MENPVLLSNSIKLFSTKILFFINLESTVIVEYGFIRGSISNELSISFLYPNNLLTLIVFIKFSIFTLLFSV